MALKPSETQVLFHYLEGAAVPDHLFGPELKRAYQYTTTFETEHEQKPSRTHLIEIFNLTDFDELDPLPALIETLKKDKDASTLEHLFNAIAKTPDPTEALQKFEKVLEENKAVEKSTVLHRLSDFEPRLIQYRKDKREGRVPRVASFGPNFRQLTEEMNGLERSDCVVIYGRPGGFKSTLSRYISIGGVQEGKKVLFFTMEEDIETVLQMLEAAYTGIDQKAYLRKTLSEVDLERHHVKLMTLNTPGMGDVIVTDAINSVFDIPHFLAQVKPDYFVLDQLTLVSSSVDYKDMTEAIRPCKMISKRTGIPGVILTQSNQKGDIAFSFSIYGFADKIIRTGSEPPELFVVKNRRGAKGATIPLQVRFEEGIFQEVGGEPAANYEIIESDETDTKEDW